jgi:hypothetical protein
MIWPSILINAYRVDARTRRNRRKVAVPYGEFMILVTSRHILGRTMRVNDANEVHRRIEFHDYSPEDAGSGGGLSPALKLAPYYH